MKRNLIGAIIIICTLIMIFASAMLCITSIPGFVSRIMAGREVFIVPGILFMWVSSIPVFSVLIILLTVGKNINEKEYIGYFYIKKFKAMSLLMLTDAILYLIPLIFFTVPEHFDLTMIAVCVIIQLCGFCLSVISYAAATVMKKASEYKEEIDTMI